MKYHVTKHAIERYQRRFENLPQPAVLGRLLKAAHNSRLATAKEMRSISSRGGGRKDKVQGPILRVCHEQSLVLACMRDTNGMVVVTVYPLKQ